MSFIKYYFLISLIFAIITFLGIWCKKLKNELAAQKEYFIKTLGHDFRVSVIAQIRGLDLLQKSLTLDNNDLQLINDVNNSCKYTLDMITMLMKIYKLENKDLSLNFEQLNFDTLVYEVFNEFESIASEKNIDFKFDFNMSTIFADKENLSKMIKILIYTAVQYSIKASTIICSSNVCEGMNLIKIKYKGNPLSFEERNRMFSKNSNYSTVGCGIQMSLCKKIVELHKGKIYFVSGSNHFNCFEICIPKLIR